MTTLMLPLAALFAGGFAFLVTLWASRYGTGVTVTGERLARMRADMAGGGGSSGMPSLVAALRKRPGANAALVPSEIAAKWAATLERAGLTLTVREYLILRIGVGAALFAFAMMFSPIPQIAILGLPLGFWGVGVWLGMRVNGRRKKMEKQLVEALQVMSSGLRSGFGFLQALEAAAEQSQQPLNVELRRTLRDIAIGSSVEQALKGLNDRVGSADFDIVITAIMIQRTVGGNLGEILDNVAHTMRERERIAGEIQTLTSQQRLTGYVIGGVPIALLIIFNIISPDFASLMFTTNLGKGLLLAVVGLQTIGFLIIKKIVNIEV